MSDNINQDTLDDVTSCVTCGVAVFGEGHIVCASCSEEFKSDDPITALQNKCDMLEEIVESCEDQIFSLNKTLEMRDSKIERLESKLKEIRALTK
jgi:uncharacterized Zn finger protein (UPF0148 family)